MEGNVKVKTVSNFTDQFVDKWTYSVFLCENLLTFHLPFMLTFLGTVLHFNSCIFSLVQKFNITLAMH